MTQYLFVKWTAKPTEVRRIQALLPELVRKTRAEPGNISYTVYQSESDPAVFILHECYADAAAVDRHRRSEHYQHVVVEQINPGLAAREVIVVKPFPCAPIPESVMSKTSVISKKVLIIVSNAHEIGPRRRRTGNFLPEVAHPYAEFDRAHHQIDFASLTGETPYLDALNLADDPDNLSFLVGTGWAAMQRARKLSDVDAGVYDAIFMPGGLAPMVDMPEHALLKQVIKEAYERGAVVGAVCHGPVSLLNVKLSNGSYLVAGKNISAFTTEEENGYAKADVPFDLETALTRQGAIVHKADPWAPFSIAHGKLVTGQNPASAKGVAEKMIDLLETRSREGAATRE